MDGRCVGHTVGGRDVSPVVKHIGRMVVEQFFIDKQVSDCYYNLITIIKT